MATVGCGFMFQPLLMSETVKRRSGETGKIEPANR